MTCNKICRRESTENKREQQIMCSEKPIMRQNKFLRSDHDVVVPLLLLLALSSSA